jgi:ABC-type transport system involved in multi-copper enzyme maturation permease subunit
VRLLQAEALKVRTAPRTLLGLVLALMALDVLGSGSTASGGGPDFVPNADEIVTFDVLTVATTGVIFALILGILIVTWEYRHGTITQTFLATPQRERVMAAKYAVSFGTGAILTALSVVVVLVTALFWISPVLHRDQWELIGRLVVASALWGILGAGLGALIQSQVGAIIAAFVWFLVVEPLIGVRFEHFADYLPGAVIDRLTGHEVSAEHTQEATQYSFGLWTAGLLAAVYALGAAVLGAASAAWRDIS